MASIFDSLGSQTDRAGLKKRNLDIRRTLRSDRKLAKSKKGSKLRKELESNRAKANPVDPSTGASLRDVETSARSDTRTKYGSSYSDVMKSVSGQENLIKQLPGWEEQYQAQLGALATAQAGQANAIRDSLVANAESVAQQDAASQQQLADRAGNNQFAQPVLQQAKDASAARTSLAKAQGANIAAGGTIRSQATQALQTAEKKGATERMDKEKKRLSELYGSKSEIEQAIGDYFNERKSSTLSDIGDRQVKAAAAKASNAVAQQNANTSLMRAKNDAKNQRVSHRLTARGLSERERHDRAMERRAAARGGSVGGLTPSRERILGDDLTSAVGRVNTWRKQGWQDAEIVDTLKGAGLIQGGKGLSSGNSGLETVVMHAANGTLTSGDIKRIHDKGLHVPKAWLKLYKR